MYLKLKRIAVLKFKNALFLLAGLFFMVMSVWDIVSLIVYYWGEWDTILHARSMPESAVNFIIGCILLICIKISGEAIKKAHFYSSYFETALYSDVEYDELSNVTGYKASQVRCELHILRKLYMKRFSFVQNDNGEHVELYSKTVQCRCKNCGAVIDKKIYFAGICPYCKTSDIFAAVITDNQVYSIKEDTSDNKSKPGYYLPKDFWLKISRCILALSLAITALIILIAITTDTAAKYNDREYLLNLVLSGKGYASTELNQKQLMNFILFDIFSALILIPIVYIGVKKIVLMAKSFRFANIFSHSNKPFLDFVILNARKPAALLRKMIQNGYIKNCTIENPDGTMTIALAKKIVRDSCPSCGASVTGAVDENYICPFCKNKIIKVIEKK